MWRRGAGSIAQTGSVPLGEDSTNRQRLDLLMRLLFAAFSLVGLIPVTLAVRDSTPSVFALVPIALAFAAAVVSLMRWPPATGLVILSLALVLSIVLPIVGLNGASRTLLGCVGFFLVVHYTRAQVTRQFIGVVVFYVALHLLTRPPAAWLAPIDDAILSASLTLTGAAFMAVLVATLTRLDEVRADRVQRELARSFEANDSRASADSRHLIHNEVIGTLSAVADYRDSGGPQLRLACRRVAHLLSMATSDAHIGESTLTSLVTRAASDTMVNVSIAAAGDDPELDDAQFVAIDRAVREGLRNIRRHAGVDKAAISWERHSHGWQLRLVDQGAGSLALTGSWGVTHAIAKSMSDIGGKAEVNSVPNEGTVVVLMWPARPAAILDDSLASVHLETVRSLGDDSSLALKVAVPILLANSWLMVRYSWNDTRQAGQILLGTLILGTALLAVLRLRRGPLSRWWLFGQSAGAAAAIALGIALAEPDSLRGYDSWVVGFSIVALTVCAFYVPLRWALGLALPSLVVVVVAAVQSGLPLAATGTAINTAFLPILLGYSFGAYLRSTRATIDEEELRVARSAQEVHFRQVAGLAKGIELAYARSAAGPWLELVADGRVSLGALETRAEAQRLAIDMRDELHMPGVLDRVLRGRIASARRRGVVVELLPCQTEARGAHPYLRLLDRALDLGDGLERVIVALPSGDRPEGEVVVLPPVANHDLRFLVRCLEGSDFRVVQDVFSTRILISNPQFAGRG